MLWKANEHRFFHIVTLNSGFSKVQDPIRWVTLSAAKECTAFLPTFSTTFNLIDPQLISYRDSLQTQLFHPSHHSRLNLLFIYSWFQKEHFHNNFKKSFNLAQNDNFQENHALPPAFSLQEAPSPSEAQYSPLCKCVWSLLLAVCSMWKRIIVEKNPNLTLTKLFKVHLWSLNSFKCLICAFYSLSKLAFSHQNLRKPHFKLLISVFCFKRIQIRSAFMSLQ